ncbi:membrane protein insertase YidC [Bounagaea algeriensis]
MSEIFAFILYPVSAILWFWHQVFGFVLGPENGFAWALSVFFLVFTLRVLLIKPALSQMRSARKMQKFAPQIQKVKDKYKNDRQRQAQEMQKLQSEHGVNPLGGCLPVLVQLPVFLSLFHVLRNFTPGAESNYVFDAAGVDSFINAHIFGAKLSNTISQSEAVLEEFGTDRMSMVAVGVPLMIVASVATFFTMRMSMRRQSDMSMANPQTAAMGKIMMYIAPIGALVSGWILPIAVLLYWLANNAWTLGQQHFLTNKVDREQQREKEQEKERKQQVARPKPGQKPVRSQPSQSSQPSQGESSQDENGSAVGDEDAGSGARAEPAAAGNRNGQAKAKTNGQPGSGKKTNGQPGSGKSQNQNARGGKKKSQQKKRSGKQAASAKKGKKRR